MNNNSISNITERLLKCLEKVSDMSSAQIQSYNQESNYFDENVLDSMGFMLFVVEIENEFDLSFTPENLQSYEFQSIKGVAKIIYSLLE